MTDARKTHIYFLLDRSGSMASIKSATEEGFDAFIEEQRAGDGTCFVSLAQFDEAYEIVYTSTSICDVPHLDLHPRGRTALLDSMGRLIHDAGIELAALNESERPGTVIVAIMTDGHENASTEYSHAAIKAMVEHQTEKYDWQFLYMGADQDAIEVGRSIGVHGDYAVTYARDKAKYTQEMVGRKVRDYRSAKLDDIGASMPAFAPSERREAAE
ncbi:hypothetical protein AXK58_06025 [Tsukamurella tyrosinosolvens]|uniref:VWA domain-containing protein n=1 Tax=Tsukamurella tyrosinosolvens TaxID=57704 RepID=A0A1H4MDU3_TSUTY|nr:vWA domain-containing protein [Tsukamurella tyrosinosolvens]KXO96830.1 hypothetical protein AXK58_06025 [Tsukamurella tyrosinosolvens]SEB80904.1 hypothetical protein SAMN04489793_0827 [Tsukamurella tyrosinosolvens]